MYTKHDLLNDLEKLNIDRKGTLFVHSSMKSIGEVEGGADTVLDALSEYMKDGLLVLPTHTWSYIRGENTHFYVDESPSCVGILSELFRKRPNVYRSWHPTHSVAALGKDAEEFVKGEERFDTPCARESCYGKLLDRKATILLIGVDLRRNTFIHGVEEWANVPGRFKEEQELLYTVLPDGTKIPVPSKRHVSAKSEHYWKVDEIFRDKGVMHLGGFGDATVRVCNTVKMTARLYKMFEINIELFTDNEPIVRSLYDHIEI